MITYQQNNVWLPKWISNKAILFYFIALLVVSVVYSQFSLPWYYMLSGVLFVVVFFFYSNLLSKRWNPTKIQSDKRFEKKIFWASFAIRFVWMTLIYIIFQAEYGDAFGFENMDASFYDDSAQLVASCLRRLQFDKVRDCFGEDVDFADIGYATYLGVVYAVFDDSIYISRIIKCFFSAWTVVMMYRIAKNNFGDNVARLTSIFCMLWPNFWYYCGVSLKETEMIFLSVLFIEQADKMLRTIHFSVWRLIPLLFISGVLFSIRTVLAILSILCLLFAIVMTSTKVIGWGKRILIGVFAVGMISVTIGNTLLEQAKALTVESQSDAQQKNMEWRSERENGNEFAKYAGRAVFAPMIFTIPFSTMVRPFEGQESQQLLNGGNFSKNIISFFVILSMFMILFSGRWRDHILSISFLLGYLIILAVSQYAQSERFHQPAMPFEMMFAAYGISQVLDGVQVYKNIGGRVKYKRWFNIWCCVMLLATIGWNWFKLAGRGLI